MAAKVMKSAFMTGVHYLNHIQYSGESYKGMQMINRRFEFGDNFYNKDLYAHYGCVNAVEFSNDGEWLVSGGDDQRVLLWNVDKALSSSYEPKTMKGEHNSNIFCLGFNSSHSRLFSAGNDEQVILHDVNTGEMLNVFLDDEAVYGLSVDPKDENVFLSACDGGRVLLWDTRVSQISQDPITLASCPSAFHAVMYNPVETQYVVTGNAKDGISLWDTRKPKTSVMKYGPSKGAMSVRFNATGTHILALRRRLPPVLYDITCTQPAAEFDHTEYYNSCTMKSCCFAGDRDQFVLSGSDDFKLYVWRVPDSLSPTKREWIKQAHFVLRGHRSIVNQVRYNHAYGILASSGVEKIIKLWSSFQLSNKEALDDYVTSADSARKVYTHEEYISLVLESGQFMTHDYSHHSVQEDPRMMAFFDSLVQRDIEGWTSDSVDASDVSLSTCFEVQSVHSSDTSSSSSSSSSTESDDEQTSPSHVVTGATNVLYSSQNTQYLRPITLMFAAAKKEMATVHSGNSENEASSSVDRISQLIAEKRKESKLKISRASMSHKNFKAPKSRNKRSKSNTISKGKFAHKKSKSKTFIQLSHEGSHSENKQEPKTVTQLVAKDKRKILLKKRAKLVKEDATFMNSSSDSDSNCDDIELKCNSVNTDNVEVQNRDDKKLNCEKSLVDSSEQQNSENSKDKILPNSSNDDNVIANGTNLNEPLVSFSTKNGKRNKRNYRKRSAEDIDED